jgi:hypothetical protein
MIQETKFLVPADVFQLALNEVPTIDFKLTLNQPTGRFFYEPWQIKPEFKNTIWEKVLDTLPKEIGEARLIKLDPGTCYFGHSDIDDRYHLTLTGKKSYLVDLDKDKLHALKNHGLWYTMNTEPRHSAVNFGDIPRVQLVVRHLLKESEIKHITHVSITLDTAKHDYRYEFDDVLSPWLNRSCKQGVVNNFNVDKHMVSFDMHPAFLQEFNLLTNNRFNVTVNSI